MEELTIELRDERAIAALSDRKKPELTWNSFRLQAVESQSKGSEN